MVLVLLLAAAPVVHTRGVWRNHFDREIGLYLLAERMAGLCDEPGGGGRFAVVGPTGGCITVHYSRRPGWTLLDATPDEVETLRRHGAEYLLVYLNHSVPEPRRAALKALAARWPVVESGIEPWDYHDREVEYFILRLTPP